MELRTALAEEKKRHSQEMKAMGKKHSKELKTAIEETKQSVLHCTYQRQMNLAAEDALAKFRGDFRKGSKDEDQET